MTKSATTIVFYSYKGGVGRTLLLANYARFLALSKKKVLILDFDLEAPGLHFKFPEFDVQDSINNWGDRMQGLGFIDLLYFGQQEHKIASDDYIRECVRSIKLINRDEDSFLYLLGAGKAPSGNYASKILHIDWRQMLPNQGDNIAIPLLKGLKDSLQRIYQPDFILIDSRTGITDIGTVALRFLADKYVCLFLDNPENLLGMKYVLERIRHFPQVENQGDKNCIIPVLSRVPGGIRDVSTIAKQIDLKTHETLHLLRNDLCLQISEEILIGSDKALYESVALLDYFSIFSALDKETADMSVYGELVKYLGCSEKEKSSFFEFKGQLFDHAHSIEIIKNISCRGDNKFKHASFGWVKGNCYKRMINHLTKTLMEKIQLELLTSDNNEIKIIEEHVPEHKINWDLLALEMQAQEFDFCSEPYLLTKYRALNTGIIQFAWARTFTCYVKKDSRAQEILFQAHGSLENAMKNLKELIPELEIAMMGETAATDQAAKSISPFFYGDALVFKKDAGALSAWIKAHDSSLVICDHATAHMMSKNIRDKDSFLYAENGSSSYKHLVFEFDPPGVPAGFLYPLGDRRWRYLINQSFSEVITADVWGTKDSESDCVAKELWQIGFDPLDWEDLKKVLLLGKTPEDANQWLKVF